jgi:SHS2 domain-containing protein
MYETFDHTADLGLRVRAMDLNALFEEAGEALFSAIVEDLSAVKGLKRVEIRLTSDDLEYLLFDWLRELLYHFDAEHSLFSRFEVNIAGTSLNAVAWGEEMDSARHSMLHEVKAITHHGMRVEPSETGWLAEVIVDI